MKVVLDTNVLLISLPGSSPYRIIYDFLKQEKYNLLVTHEILLEYEEIISKKSSPEVADNFLNLILALPNISLIEVYFKWGLVASDMDDNKFSDCAIASGADYLVTNDHHFDVFRKMEFPKLLVINADEFVKILK